MDALDNMLTALRPGGIVLDLQVIRPNPVVERDGEVVAEIDGEPLFRWADAATASLDARVAAGDLVEEAVDDHDLLDHYRSGPELIEGFEGKKRRIPPEYLPRLREIAEPVALRERCRLRRLRLTAAAAP